MSGVIEYPNRRSPAADAVDAYLEVFFRCKETVNPDGSGSMVDAVRGATYQPSVEVGATLINGSTTVNSLTPTIVNPVALAAGTWPNFLQRSVVIFAAGILVDGTQLRIPIGKGNGDLGFPGGTGGLISLSLAVKPHVLINGATAQIAAASGNLNSIFDLPPAGTYVGVVLEFEPLAQADPRILAKVIDVNGDIFDFGTPPYVDEEENLITPMPTLLEYTGGLGQTATADCNPGLNNQTRFEGLSFYGFAAYSFPGSLPSRAVLDAAYVEMMDDWQRGERKPPSQFRYLTQIP